MAKGKQEQSDTAGQIQNAALNIADICQTKGDKNTCYQQELSNLAKVEDLFFAEKILNNLQDIDPFTRSCHVLAHRMAEAATRRDPTKWKDLVNQVNVASCGAGFLHGVLETHTSSDPNFRVTSESINELCKEGAPDRKRMCAHFLAHILILQNDGNTDVSLPICKGVTDDLQFDCFDGIFMEKHQKNIMVDHQLTKPPTFNTEYVNSQAQDCNLLDGVVATACWTEMAEIYAKAYGYEQEKIFDNCYQAPNQELGRSCYLKGVVVLTTYPDFDTADKLVSVCQPYYGKTEYGTCITYIISALMNYSVNFTERAIKLCSNISETSKEGCFKDLGNLLKVNADLSSREKLCQDAPDQYKKYCVST